MEDIKHKSCQDEIWRNILGYETFYQISNLGMVRSFDREVNCIYGSKAIKKSKILNLFTRKGYLLVGLDDGIKQKQYSVHRLVAIAFIPNPENKRCVNHKNSIRSDNRVENLEWATHSENNLHAFRVGKRTHPKGMLGKIGSKSNLGNTGALSPFSKKVIQMTLDGVEVKIWDAINDAGRSGFSHGNIVSCCQGKRLTHKGYKWKYL
jgi:hypothetical protein